MTYLFRCRNCDTPFTAQTREPRMPYCCDEPSLKRDYRAERAGFSMSTFREGTSGEIRDLFLPTAEEYVGPDDPDGSKGIEKWNREHVPAKGNTNPMRPERPLHSKKIF